MTSLSRIACSVLALSLCACPALISGRSLQDDDCTATGSASATLLWQEDFNPCSASENASGTCLNNGIRTATWAFEYGDGSDYVGLGTGWGNGEAECYTSSNKNAYVTSDGVLNIQVLKVADTTPCANARSAHKSTKGWTSARLTTKTKKAFKWSGTAGSSKPVRIAARIKFPDGPGSWPQFWLLPNTSRTDCMACGAYGEGWCSSGTIVVAEHSNSDNYVKTNIQFGGKSATEHWLNCYDAPRRTCVTTPTTAWHEYAVEWDSDYISWQLDGKEFARVDRRKKKDNSPGWWTGGAAASNAFAPFDQPFYLILNQAIGSTYFTSWQNPQPGANYKMMVDYIRVHQLNYGSKDKCDDTVKCSTLDTYKDSAKCSRYYGEHDDDDDHDDDNDHDDDDDDRR